MAYDDPVGLAASSRRSAGDPLAFEAMYELERPETCSVGRAMEILGERWTFLILREAFYGVRRFSDMQRNLGIARNILSDAPADARARRDPRAPPLPGGAGALRVPAHARPAATCIPP